MPQSHIVVTAKRLFCKAGSYEFGGESSAYLGAGIRYSGALAYNTATGDIFLKGSFGGGIGLGGGGSAGLSAQSGSTQAGSRSTLGSRIAAGLGFLGFDINYNYVTNDHGTRSSQGTSGSFGVAKAFGTAYAALLEGSAEGARKLGNIGTICR